MKISWFKETVKFIEETKLGSATQETESKSRYEDYFLSQR